MLFTTLPVFLAAAAIPGVLAYPFAPSGPGCKPPPKGCPPFQGNFTIEEYQLYPENAEFDTESCLLYISNIYTGTVSAYDPYKNEVVEVIEFPGITRTPEAGVFVAGLDIDKRTGLISILANAAAAFMQQPAGSNVSGSNLVMLWDPKTKKEIYRVNLTETTQGQYGGFADLEQDPRGNFYINSMFPGSILKLDRFNGRTPPKVTEWFLRQPRDTSIDGFGGIAAKDWTLLTHDNGNGQLLKFDMRSSSGSPLVIPVSGNHTFFDSDALALPEKYKSTVLLIAGGPGIRVFRSKNGEWDTAEYLGTVAKASFGLPPNYLATAALQVGNGLNMVVLPTGDNPIPTEAGNRTSFPFYDITDRVEQLLAV